MQRSKVKGQCSYYTLSSPSPGSRIVMASASDERRGPDCIGSGVSFVPCQLRQEYMDRR